MNNPAPSQGNLPSTAVKLAQFKQELGARKSMLAAMLPPNVPVEKFVIAVSSAVANNPELLDVYRPSLFKACVEAAELGLSLNPVLRESDVLVNWNGRTKRKEASFRPRYGGYVKLARQSGEIRDIYAYTVRQGDEFSYELGMHKDLRHKPAPEGRRGEVIAAYCIWELTNGAKDFEVMDRAQLDGIKARTTSKTREGVIVGPWVTDEEQMQLKSVVRRAAKFMPLSTTDHLRSAVEIDNAREFTDRAVTVDHETGEVTYDDEAQAGPETEAIEHMPEMPMPMPTENRESRASQKLNNLENQRVQVPENQKGNPNDR